MRVLCYVDCLVLSVSLVLVFVYSVCWFATAGGFGLGWLLVVMVSG